jgi:hypothetical protein
MAGDTRLRLRRHVRSMIAHQSTPTTLAPDWNNLFLIISGKGVAIDKRIAATVAYLKRCPASKVPGEAMRARWVHSLMTCDCAVIDR